MMERFKPVRRIVAFVDQLPVRRKLTLAAILTSILAVFVSSGIFTVVELTTLRRSMGDDLMTQAEILAHNSTAALVFEDAVAAKEMLSALSAKAEVEAAALYTIEGAELAVYGNVPTAVHHDGALQLEPGVRFGVEYLEVVRTVELDGRQVGWLYVSSNTDQWYARIRLYLLLVVGLCAFTGLLTVPVSSRLQRLASEPLLSLGETMQRVSLGRDYSLRAPVQSADEVGRLTIGFNDMLAELQWQDAEQKTLNETLEERVAERNRAVKLRARELARSRSELKKQTEILESVLESMAEGVLVANQSGELILSNRTARTTLGIALHKDSKVQADVAFTLYRSDNEVPLCGEQHPLMRAVSGETVDSEEFLIHPEHKSEDLWLTVNACPLGGAYRGAVLVFRDITPHKLHERELREARDSAEMASRAKSQFLANMSHELRTPLNAILGYSEMLVEETEENDDQDHHDDLNRINSAGKHLLAVINDILDLSKIEAGRLEATVESFDFRRVLDEVAATILPLAKKNSNEFKLVVPEEIQLVSDETKLRQVLLNLLGNACKFTENGSVTLSAKLHDAGDETLLAISVEDTGIGMKPDQVESVFEPFVQADPSITRKYGGTGLGLAISRQICRLLGGDLGLESIPGGGSTFRVWIPAILGEDSAQPVSTFPTQKRTAFDDSVAENCVIIIDNDSDSRALLSWLVLKQGLRPVACEDAEMGIEAVRRHQPRAITMDVLMDGMDGWTALEVLKDDPELRHIPVVMVTVVDDPGRAKSLGAFGHFTKPLDTVAFQRTIERCQRAQFETEQTVGQCREKRSA